MELHRSKSSNLHIIVYTCTVLLRYLLFSGGGGAKGCMIPRRLWNDFYNEWCNVCKNPGKGSPEKKKKKKVVLCQGDLTMSFVLCWLTLMQGNQCS